MWGLGGDPARHRAPAPLPRQRLFVSTGRAQHRQVESWGKGERKLQGIFLNAVSSSKALLPFLSQEQAVSGLVNTAWLVLAAECWLDQTPDKLKPKPKCVWLLLSSCIFLEADYFAVLVLIDMLGKPSQFGSTG